MVERPGPGEELNAGAPSTPRPAATVILLRGGAEALEVLLVKRNPAQRFMGGAWVFPGGAVDAAEGDDDAAHRRAGVREVAEEAGVALADADALVTFSRWITPEAVRIRFDTLFFLARAPAGADPRPDGSETVDLGWFTPQGALDAYARDEIVLVFPTIKTARAARGLRLRRRAARLGRGARCQRRGPARGPARARRLACCSRASRGTTPEMPLTVAVTGPTGDIGRALLRGLDGDPAVERVLGMARRPFDPAAMGLRKTEYRQGDVLDREAVDALAEGADVVVHLAFIIVGGRDETRSVNLEGSRNVFAAAAAAPASSG